MTLRNTTEWVELVDNEVNILLNIDKDLTKNITCHLHKKIDNSTHLYGDGNSSKIIIENLIKYSVNGC